VVVLVPDGIADGHFQSGRVLALLLSPLVADSVKFEFGALHAWRGWDARNHIRKLVFRDIGNIFLGECAPCNAQQQGCSQQMFLWLQVRVQFLGNLEAELERLDVTLGDGCIGNVQMLPQKALIERADGFAPVMAVELFLRPIL